MFVIGGLFLLSATSSYDECKLCKLVVGVAVRKMGTGVSAEGAEIAETAEGEGKCG